MPNSTAPVIGLALLWLGTTAPALAADADSLFKTKAELQDQRVLQKLKREIQAEEKALGVDGEAPSPQSALPALASKKPALPPPALVEIVGSSGHLLAAFRMPNGTVLRAVPHQIVPGFGEVRSITPSAVENEHGHWSSVERSAEE
jgi:type IV pilus biogenesis protein PilP